jgi:hypothetical protein
MGLPHFAYQAMADDFVKICSKDSKDEPIIYKISEFQKTQVIRNRHILMKTMETPLVPASMYLVSSAIRAKKMLALHLSTIAVRI